MRERVPIALTIAGSDSGGGAGIQADLKVFAALGVHGTSVVTCVTAQNPKHVRNIEAVSGGMVRDQLAAVFDELPPKAAKTGMLYSREIIRVVMEFWGRLGRRQPPLIVDPVLASTSGVSLLPDDHFESLKELLSLADLATPNLIETRRLLGREISDVEEMRQAARDIHRQFGCAALIKGGHLEFGKEAADVFYDGKNELLLTAPFVRNIRTHGTGCAYSAAITGYLASGWNMPDAVAGAKNFITPAIAHSLRTSKHHVLNPFWRRK